MASRYGLQIRTADPGDAPGIADLLGAAGRPIAASILAARLDALRREPGAALLAVEWGPPSGLVVLHWFRTLADDGPVAQISALLVGPDDRRRGIGRALLKSAAQAARSAGCAALHLPVPGADASLVAFCEATGFTETGPGFVRPLRKHRSPAGPD